ncbi:MAG: hypothetical protein RR324_00545 [Cellulosilyticaceae bacterium]
MSHDELYEHPSPLEPITNAKSAMPLQGIEILMISYTYETEYT